MHAGMGRRTPTASSTEHGQLHARGDEPELATPLYAL